MSNSNNLVFMNSETAKERGRIGGIKSGISRIHRKKIRELAFMLFDMQVTEEMLKSESLKYIYEYMTCGEALVIALMRKAIEGDVRAATWLRDTAGQKPTK